MARTVKPEEYASKRKEILDVAQRLVLTKGYEQMAIRDILEELQISSGAFHHYFNSRGALLEALAERLQEEMEQRVLPIAQDPKLPALEKLRNALATILRREINREAATLLIALLRIWFTDDNALIRQKVDAARVKRLAPLLTEIVRQGIQEGSFSPISPHLIGELILYQIQGLQYALASRHAAFELDGNVQQYVEAVVEVYDAYMNAIERLLGVSSPFLYRTDASVIKETLVINKQMTSISKGD